MYFINCEISILVAWPNKCAIRNATGNSKIAANGKKLYA